MKVKTILSRIYYIIVAVCVFLHVVILSLSFFDNKHQEKYCRSIIPDREYQTDEDNRRFVFSAQKIKDGGDCLRFYTALHILLVWQSVTGQVKRMLLKTGQSTRHLSRRSMPQREKK